MPYRLTLSRVLGLSVVTGVGILAQEGAAHATIATELATKSSTTVDAGIPGDHVEYLAQKYNAPAPKSAKSTTIRTPETAKPAPKVEAAKPAPKTEAPKVEQKTEAPVTAASAPSCNGSNAISSVTYTVDGKVVTPGLRGNVNEGSTVEVDFKVKDGCDDVSLGLAAYQAPSNRWVPAEAEGQVLVDHDAGKFDSDGKSHHLEVTAPGCNFQIDFFTGPVLHKLTATDNYSKPVNNLISADNDGTKDCDVPPPAPPPPPVVHKDLCPANVHERIVSYSWTINGVEGFKTLAGNVKPGDVVEVEFTIAAGCEDVELSLVSYDAPSGSFTRDSADEQKLFDSETGKFDAGTHELEVDVPGCYYQVDFVRGGVLTTLGPENTNNFYGDQGRLIEAGNGGVACVTETPAEPDVVVAPEVQVLGATAEPLELAETGVESSSLAMLGASLMLLGAALERGATRLRRKPETGRHYR